MVGFFDWVGQNDGPADTDNPPRTRAKTALRRAADGPPRGCEGCPLKGSKVVQGEGIPKARILLVGQAPGKREVELGRVFVGPAGSELRANLESARIREYALCNAVRCRPVREGRDREPTAKELYCCSVFLEKDIKENRPERIVALGKSAFQALIPLSKFPGVERLRGGFFVLPQDERIRVAITWHPAAILYERIRSNALRKEQIEDLVRVRRSLERSLTPMPGTLIVNSVEKAERILEGVADQVRTAIDVEGNSENGRIYSIQFSLAGGRCGVTIPVDHPESRLLVGGRLHPKLSKIIRRILTEPRPRITGQAFNGFDRTILESYFGVKIKELEWDTLYGSYIHDERSDIHRLELIAARWLGLGGYDHEMRLYLRARGTNDIRDLMESANPIPLSILGKYGARDAAITHLCALQQMKKTSTAKKRLVRVTQTAALATSEMEREGIGFDCEYSKKLYMRYEERLAKIEKRLRLIAGEPNLNVAAAKQIGEVLFDKLKLKGGKRTPKSGQWATDETVLKKLVRDSDHPFPKLLMEWRDLSKDASTFIRGLQELVGPDGRIHLPTFLHGTESGRASFRLHNVKHRWEKQPDGTVRDILWDQFKARDNYVFIAADYSQIELRMTAELSGDENMISVYLNDGDIHHETAVMVYGLKLGEKETEEQRIVCKTGMFGMLYGLDAKGLYEYYRNRIEDFWMSLEEVAQFREDWFRAYPKVKIWQKKQIEDLYSKGYVTNLFGRTRHLNPWQGKHAENQAVNSPIQATAHDIMLMAMAELVSITDRRYRFIMEQHDKIILEVPREEETQTVELCRKVMTDPSNVKKWLGRKLRVPLKVEVKVGDRLGGLS